jgi:hypothetical protein
LKHIDGPVELGVTSVSKSFWINVHELMAEHIALKKELGEL